MTELESSPSGSIGDLIKQGFQPYLPVLRCLWPVILLWVLVKNIIFYCDRWLPFIYIDEGLWWLLIFISLFAFVLLLHQTAMVLENRQEDIKQSVLIILKIFPKIVLVNIFMTIVLLGSIVLLRWLASLFAHSNSDIVTWMIFLFMGAVLYAEVLYFFFIMPLMVIEHMSIWKAFITSGKFVEDNIKLITFIYFITMIVIVLVAPYTVHALWLRDHYLVVPFDAVVLMALLPWLLSMIVVATRNLQLSINQ